MEKPPCSVATACRMNLSALVAPGWLMLCATAGLLFGLRLEQRPLLGLAIGAIVGHITLLLLIVGHVVSMLWCPERPRCRCGACGSEGYEFAGLKAGSSDSILCFYRCSACARTYGSYGSRFLEIGPDGTGSSYMRLSKLGRWVPDERDESPTPDRRWSKGPGAPHQPPDPSAAVLQLQRGGTTLR